MFYASNCEILIMDNGSTDETGKLLEKYRENKHIKIGRNKKHKGIAAYKNLFNKAKGEYIIEIDDDVIEFPQHFDKTMVDYMNTYTDYGFVALNVIQNEHTNGAKPDDSQYTEDVRGDKIIQQGPTGGWCTCFRKRDYRKIRLYFNLMPLSFRRGEDGTLSGLFGKYLRLKSGIIKNQVCFHATGPYYANQYDHLAREIEKYEINKFGELADLYKSFLNK